jgi:uncharacterized membrane-anchored protein
MAKLLLEALDMVEAGDLEGAHAVVRDYDGEGAAWLHAHIHRVEGDEDNARHWYGEANMAPFEGDVTEERYALRQELTSGKTGMMGQPPQTG